MKEKGLYRKTLTMVLAMVGAWFVLMGTLSAITILVTSRLAGPREGSDVTSETAPPAPEKHATTPTTGGVPARSVKSKTSTEI